MYDLKQCGLNDCKYPEGRVTAAPTGNAQSDKRDKPAPKEGHQGTVDTSPKVSKGTYIKGQ